MKISYLICAAGQGTRTKEISSEIPKPLLRLDGKTLLQHALESLPLRAGDQIIVIGQGADDLSRLKDDFLKLAPDCEWRWLDLDSYTKGQLETASLAIPHIPMGHAVAVFNADSSFSPEGLREAMESSVWDGVIPCSIESGDAWSFCSVQEDGNQDLIMTDIAEKQRISDWCSVGFYFFRDLGLFKAMTQEELSSGVRGELYVSALYQRYLEKGRRIRVFPIHGFRAMGSVEQIKTYWGLSVQEVQKQQRS